MIFIFDKFYTKQRRNLAKQRRNLTKQRRNLAKPN